MTPDYSIRIVPGHDVEVFERHPSWTMKDNEVGEVHVAAWDTTRQEAHA